MIDDELMREKFHSYYSNDNDNPREAITYDEWIHNNIQCSNCKQLPIVGTRYTCLQCGFDPGNS